MTTQPSSAQPTGEDQAAINDLTALATELHRRGYTTHLTPIPPTLDITHPHAHGPHQTETIHAGPDDYTWQTGGEHVPIEADRTDPLTHTANQVDELFWTLNTCDTTDDLIDALISKYLDTRTTPSTPHGLMDWLWLHLGGSPDTTITITITCDSKAIQWT